MGLPGQQDSDELGIGKSACRQQHFFRSLHSLENSRRWRLWQDGFQPTDSPLAEVGIPRVLRREMKAPFGQPIGPLSRNAIVLRRFARVFHKQQPVLHQLRDSRTHAPWRVIGEMSNRLCGSSPLAKEIENFASKRFGGDVQSSGKIIKKQPPVPPICEQAPSPPQLDRPLPHLFRLTEYACRNSVRMVYRPGPAGNGILVNGIALSLFLACSKSSAIFL